ncbi:MAG: glycerophosphodiester phosphodiesterase family protein [Rhizobiaceae bacterium]
MRRSLVILLAALFALWAGNSSFLRGPAEDARTRLLAHRGVHQTFSPAAISNETCTASRIDPPVHDLIENTLASMAAAFAAGAEVVEFDVHPTPDGHVAVFHDWTLGCRTDGQGVTRDTAWEVLRTLDVGYGYTADGGRTFLLRGTGVGRMPDLQAVMTAFPDRRFLVNFKSNDMAEGQAFAALVAAHPSWRSQVFAVYGGEGPTRAAQAALPGLKGYDRRSVMRCGLTYLALGWSGYVPAACRNTILPVPVDFAFLLWGYPHVLSQRLEAAGTTLALTGPLGDGGFTSGIDTAEIAARVPPRFDGLVWTNRIREIAPLLNGR